MQFHFYYLFNNSITITLLVLLSLICRPDRIWLYGSASRWYSYNELLNKERIDNDHLMLFSDFIRETVSSHEVEITNQQQQQQQHHQQTHHHHPHHPHHHHHQQQQRDQRQVHNEQQRVASGVVTYSALKPSPPPSIQSSRNFYSNHSHYNNGYNRLPHVIETDKIIKSVCQSTRYLVHLNDKV